MPPMTSKSPEVLRLARERFGVGEWRGLQAEALDGVLAGQDLFVTMPTGSGKSLIFQLPALVLDGLTLVISPLIALMKDQVDALRERGVRARCVHSLLGPGEREQFLAEAERGELDLLYVTPERFRTPGFAALAPRLGVTRLAIDEAHCISAWGHDFRPDYARLREARALLGDPPTVALTATATPRVLEDVCTQLALEDPLVLRAGVRRPNLFLAAKHVDDREERIEHLLGRIEEIDGPGIVYFALIRELEALHSELQQRGHECLVYHGKLSSEERHAMQERFLSSKRCVVLATNAFGMGVDKSNVRFVLHAQIPGTLEAWAQELGRAGRDGEPALCELVYFEEDLAVQQNFVQWANPTREFFAAVYETIAAWGERVATKEIDDLKAELLVKQRGDRRTELVLRWLDTVGVLEGSFERHDLRVARPLTEEALPAALGTDDKLRADLSALLAMLEHAKDHQRCRQQRLEEHFGLELGDRCGSCDACTDVEGWVAESFVARPGRVKSVEGDGAISTEDDEVPGSAYARGDWLRVDGRWMGCVVKVEGRGKQLRLHIEHSRDLRIRVIDPRRRRVEPIE
jgi:ATP-dependent DNA helicase RecQ